MKQQIAGFPNRQNPSGLIQTDKFIQIYSGNQLFFPGMSDQFCPGKIRFQLLQKRYQFLLLICLQPCRCFRLLLSAVFARQNLIILPKFGAERSGIFKTALLCDLVNGFPGIPQLSRCMQQANLIDIFQETGVQLLPEHFGNIRTADKKLFRQCRQSQRFRIMLRNVKQHILHHRELCVRYLCLNPEVTQQMLQKLIRPFHFTDICTHIFLLYLLH